MEVDIMHLIYPAVFHEEDGAYWVEFPDLEGCQSFGDSLEETVINAKEALEGYAVTLLEQGRLLNEPSDITTIQCDEDAFTTLIECDITNKFATARAVKKTLTIPAWLNDMAVEQNVNFSQTLQNALIEKLNITQ